VTAHGGIEKKPTMFAQCLAAAGKDCYYFYISVCHKLALPFETICHKSPKVVVTKSIVFCYYGKMLQLRKYTLMI